jgi:uncharacterized protein YjbI with pentapeptide repeats
MFHGRRSVLCFCLLSGIMFFFPVKSARADIYQWQWVDPSDPSLGKQQSATLCPDGAGVNAEPYAFISGRNLTQAYLIGADLHNTSFYQTTLTNADLSLANLTNADLYYADLTNANLSHSNLTDAFFYSGTLIGANFTDAVVRGANFGDTVSNGFTSAQLYSTASYKAKDLTGIKLNSNDLTGWNFSGQNLSNAHLISILKNTNFTDAVVQGVNFSGPTYDGGFFIPAQLYSTASYKANDLTGIMLETNNLKGWNFANQNLTNASFHQSDLIGTIFSDAIVQETDFSDIISNGFKSEQIYSTASYKNKNLTGIKLSGNTLIGWNFANQNLTEASFAYSYLKNVNFSQANLSTSSFYVSTLYNVDFSLANLINAYFWDPYTTWFGDLSGADLRGANILSLAGMAITNTIFMDGSIAGLDLSGERILIVRDYDGDLGQFDYSDKHAVENWPIYTQPHGPIAITVLYGMNMGADGILKMIFEQDDWDSLISFDPGIPVALGGTLELTFAEGVDIAGQIGRTIQIFDWSGVAPTGTFNVSSAYDWDLSHLYTSGEITLVPEPASVVLMGAGLLSLLCFRLFRRHTQMIGG